MKVAFAVGGMSREEGLCYGLVKMIDTKWRSGAILHNWRVKWAVRCDLVRLASGGLCGAAMLRHGFLFVYTFLLKKKCTIWMG